MKQGADGNGDVSGSAIPAKLQRRAGRLLAAGASFEETQGELRRRGAEQVSLKAVQDFFRSNPELHRERIERRRQAMEELKQALNDPDSQRRSLAEAALLTGLAELTSPAGLSRSQLNNYRLQLRTLRLKRQSATLGQRVAQTRLKLAMARWEMARLKLTDLERELEQELGQRHLHLPAVEKIRYIHALISNSPAAGRLRAPRSSDARDNRPAAAENNSGGGE